MPSGTWDTPASGTWHPFHADHSVILLPTVAAICNPRSPTVGTLREDEDDAVANEAEDVAVEQEPEARAEPEVEVVEDRRIAADDEADGEEDADGNTVDRPRHKRETAAERRARAKAAKERDKRELDFQRREMERLQRQIRELSHTQSVTRVTDLDNRIASELQTVEQMDRIRAAAISKQNGADAVAADKLKAEAQQRAYQLANEKAQIVEQANKPVVEAPPYIHLARDFISSNPWYNQDGNDEDSQLVKQIDAEVAKDFVPTSPAYWKELQRRVQKNLPHHFTGSNDDGDPVSEERPAATRKGPPVGGSSRSTSSTSSGSATQIRLSPERVQAMKEAGLWDDPKTRAKMAKKYSEYDRSQRG